MLDLRTRILQLLGEGLSQAEIARRLGVASATVSYHASFLRRTASSATPAAPVPDARRQVRTRDAVASLLSEGLGRAEIARQLGITKATVSYHAKRLGHPVDERGARRYDWDAVQQYYDTGRTVQQCVEAFGFFKETWHSARLRGDIVTRARRLSIEELCAEDTPRSRGHLRRRLIEEGLKEERCERCELTEWQGERMPLELHHRNGDRHDNRLENLQILCPNCHSRTQTHSRRKRPEAL